jgi:hypothetical protein
VLVLVIVILIAFPSRADMSRIKSKIRRRTSRARLARYPSSA